MPKREDLLKGIGDKIEQAARKFGFHVEDLTLYLTEESQMLAPLAFSGATRRYAHWSFGKKAEIFSRRIREGNINISSLDLMLLYSLPRVPILASAPPYKQATAIARAYAYMDFMRENFIWRARDFGEIQKGIEEHAKFINDLANSPIIGAEKVEQILTAAHYIAYQCSHSAALNGRTSDILSEIADNAPGLLSWQRKLLRIVHEEWVWFLPFIETHFMLKGWVSFWQFKLLEEANLSEELYWKCFLEFTNEIHLPDEPQRVNPSIVGYNMFNEMLTRGYSGDKQSFRRGLGNILQQENDISFIKNHMTEDSARASGLLSYGQRGTSGDDAKILEVKDVSDAEGWERVRDELALWVGGNAFPAICVTQNKDSELRLEQQFDGRGLNTEETEGVLASLKDALGREIHFITTSLDADGKEVKTEYYDGPNGSGSMSVNPGVNNKDFGCG